MKIRLMDGQDHLLKYKEYLDSIWPELPDGVRAFVREKWFYDYSDHRCPHDSWVEKVTIEEIGKGERKHHRTVAISARLLGAFHDRYLHFHYQGVTEYRLQLANATSPHTAHGDYLWDEIRWESGAVVHEVKFSSGSSWEIKCSDVLFTHDGLE